MPPYIRLFIRPSPLDSRWEPPPGNTTTAMNFLDYMPYSLYASIYFRVKYYFLAMNILFIGRFAFHWPNCTLGRCRGFTCWVSRIPLPPCLSTIFHYHCTAAPRPWSSRTAFFRPLVWPRLVSRWKSTLAKVSPPRKNAAAEYYCRGSDYFECDKIFAAIYFYYLFTAYFHLAILHLPYGLSLGQIKMLDALLLYIIYSTWLI